MQSKKSAATDRVRGEIARLLPDRRCAPLYPAIGQGQCRTGSCRSRQDADGRAGSLFRMRSAERSGTATVKICELLLEGVPSCGIRADQGVEVFIRPEKIVFTTPGDEKGWAGTVKDLIYSGDSIRYVISLGSAQVIVEQTVRQGVYLPARGDAVSLSWDPLEIILFPS